MHLTSFLLLFGVVDKIFAHSLAQGDQVLACRRHLSGVIHEVITFMAPHLYYFLSAELLISFQLFLLLKSQLFYFYLLLLNSLLFFF